MCRKFARAAGTAVWTFTLLGLLTAAYLSNEDLTLALGALATLAVTGGVFAFAWATPRAVFRRFVIPVTAIALAGALIDFARTPHWDLIHDQAGQGPKIVPGFATKTACEEHARNELKLESFFCGYICIQAEIVSCIGGDPPAPEGGR